MKNIYEAYPNSEKNIKVMRPGGLALTDEMIVECDLDASAKILDVGCGVGTVVHYLKSKYAYDAVGIDCSQKIIQEGLVSVPGLPIRVASAEAMPYLEATVDCILMECTLSVFQNPEKVLKEAYKVLKSGAKIAISDVYVKEKSCTSSIKTMAELEQMIKAQGFKILKWSEKTGLLRNYIAEMIWNQSGDQSGKQNNSFLSEFCSLENISGLKLGYFSLIAEK